MGWRWNRDGVEMRWNRDGAEIWVGWRWSRGRVEMDGMRWMGWGTDGDGEEIWMGWCKDGDGVEIRTEVGWDAGGGEAEIRVGMGWAWNRDGTGGDSGTKRWQLNEQRVPRAFIPSWTRSAPFWLCQPLPPRVRPFPRSHPAFPTVFSRTSQPRVPSQRGSRSPRGAP